MGKHQAAGQPPHPAPEETILPTGERSELDTDVHHLPTFNQGIDLLSTGIPRTGKGSYTGAPELGPVARFVVRAQRMRRVWRVLETVVFGSLALAITPIGGWLIYVAWNNRNNLTETELREASPLLALAAAALWMVVLLLWVLWREGRIK